MVTEQQYSTNSEKVIDNLVENIQIELMGNLKDMLSVEDINFSGKTSDSIKAEVIDNIRYVTINSPYATIVDKGLTPGTRVNFDALKNWVHVKLGINEPELTTATFKIQNKILGKGITPTFFVKKAIKKLIGKIGTPATKRYGQKNRPGTVTKGLSKTSRIIKKINKVTQKMSKVSQKITGIRRKSR